VIPILRISEAKIHKNFAISEGKIKEFILVFLIENK
jgi:hypothetical protein